METDNEIGNEGTTYLAESLKINSTLTSLNLGGKLFHLFEISHSWKQANNIGNEGTSYLAESLKINSTLIELIIHCKLFHLFEIISHIWNR